MSKKKEIWFVPKKNEIRSNIIKKFKHRWTDLILKMNN